MISEFGILMFGVMDAPCVLSRPLDANRNRTQIRELPGE